MKKPTKIEIAQEIKRLEKLKPIGPHWARTRHKINAALDELRFGVDQTADEWNEMTYEEQNAVHDALNWKEGRTKSRPSEGWEGLVEA